MKPAIAFKLDNTQTAFVIRCSSMKEKIRMNELSTSKGNISDKKYNPSKCIDDIDIKKHSQEVENSINKLYKVIAKEKGRAYPDPIAIDNYYKIQAENYKIRKCLEDELKDYPSPPILPPPGNVSKIIGVIDELNVILAKACFALGAYANMELKIANKKFQEAQGNALAQGMRILSNSTAMNSDVYDFHERIPALYLKGKINGKSFCGWFNNINIVDGDKVEMAVVEQEGHYLAYGIVNLRDETVILPPRCYSKEKQLRHWIYMVPFALFFSPFAIAALIYQPYDLVKQLLGMLFCVVVMGLVTRHVGTKNNRQFWLLYDQIDRALNIGKYKICKSRKK